MLLSFLVVAVRIVPVLAGLRGQSPTDVEIAQEGIVDNIYKTLTGE